MDRNYLRTIDKNIRDDLELYLKPVAKFKTLSDEESRYYIALAQAGDKASFDKLINHNLKLVGWVIVNHFPKFTKEGSTLTAEDLMSEGFFALKRAVEKFDLSLQYTFSTYATDWIRGLIGRALRKSEIVPTPANPVENTRKSKFLEFNGDIIPDATVPDCHDAVIAAKRIKHLLPVLTIREKSILMERFVEEKYLPEIAKTSGISTERVRQITNEALRKLRTQLLIKTPSV